MRRMGITKLNMVLTGITDYDLKTILQFSPINDVFSPDSVILSPLDIC
jgi:hypothetical protein